MKEVKEKTLAIASAIVLIVALLTCLPVYAENAETSAVILNAAPTVDVELTPDDNPATPGVQVINSNPTTNKTVTISADITDPNGYKDLISVTANITGPSIVEDSPVNLSFDSVVNPTTVAYTGSFNISNHAEGEYKVEVNATDNGGLIGVGSKNFTYSYGAPPDIIPPEVTNPSANPPLIVADGAQESQFNVTVTDESGIYSVTVDLTGLGGTAAEVMTNIPGTDIYTTTTTAAVGTSPGTYYLPVNATDNSPNSNSNTSVSIPLTVLPPEVVTTYDFTTGASSDKWAFRKQHNTKPPATNNVPRIEFTSVDYNNIRVNDNTYRVDVSSHRGYYSTHRFKFNIAEPEGSITKFDILWDGFGYHDLGMRGATLYIWNFETGAYEQLDRDTNAYVTLEGTIADNIEEYIDNDGSLIIIAEQNTRQWRFWRWTFLSYIASDYVMVDVTHTPKPYLMVLDITPGAAVVHRGEDITFEIEVRNDGAPGYGYVGGAAQYPDGTYCNTEWEKTSYLSTGDAYTAHLNWTVLSNAPTGSYGPSIGPARVTSLDFSSLLVISVSKSCSNFSTLTSMSFLLLNTPLNSDNLTRKSCTKLFEHDLPNTSNAVSNSFAFSNALAFNAPLSSDMKFRVLACHSYRKPPSAIKLQPIKMNKMIITGYNRFVEIRYIPDCAVDLNISSVEPTSI